MHYEILLYITVHFAGSLVVLPNFMVLCTHHTEHLGY